jgi:phosphorylated CTD-interacting factor 1
LTLVYCILTRYRTIFGSPSPSPSSSASSSSSAESQFSGGGLQGAVPGHVLAALSDLFGVSLECFASPMNAYFPHFCSAFPLLELPFGSIGSFFSTRFLSGSFEANPPFTATLIQQMFAHMLDLLARADAEEAKFNAAVMDADSGNRPPQIYPLSFIVIIPHWVQHFVNVSIAAV